MKVAIYCRVSTEEQTLDQQREPCIEHCKSQNWQYDIYEEKVSGSKESRKELDILMQELRSRKYQGLMVYKLDRLGRSLKHLIQITEELNNKNIQFICLNPSIDTRSASGRFFLQIMGAVAELEREMIRERTKSKLTSMKLAGKKLGRPVGSCDKKPRKRLGYYKRYSK